MPDGFPGHVLIQTIEETGEDGKIRERYVLHKDYRREYSEVFRWFVKRIVGAIGPKDREFKKKVYRNKLSEFCSVSDEAFALVLLFNEYSSWTTPTDRVNKQRKRKRFTDSASGRKEGWSIEGRTLFCNICVEIRKRREEAVSKDVENELRQAFVEEGGRNSEENEERENRRAQRRKRESEFNMDDAIDKSSAIYLMMSSSND